MQHSHGINDKPTCYSWTLRTDIPGEEDFSITYDLYLEEDIVDIAATSRTLLGFEVEAGETMTVSYGIGGVRSIRGMAC